MIGVSKSEKALLKHFSTRFSDFPGGFIKQEEKMPNTCKKFGNIVDAPVSDTGNVRAENCIRVHP